ncbi:hypothetical protein DB346_05565 [Verrucomicrobia bacterium LW23]|nr:hypothetical protein DB346_05565 [Verrucomicrobia bacterium LW23]
MPPKIPESNIFLRVLDRYGMPAAFLAVTLFALHLVYGDVRAQNERVLAAFVRQAEVSQKVAASIDALTAEIRGRK